MIKKPKLFDSNGKPPVFIPQSSAMKLEAASTIEIELKNFIKTFKLLLTIPEYRLLTASNKSRYTCMSRFTCWLYHFTSCTSVSLSNNSRKDEWSIKLLTAISCDSIVSSRITRFCSV